MRFGSIGIPGVDASGLRSHRLFYPQHPAAVELSPQSRYNEPLLSYLPSQTIS